MNSDSDSDNEQDTSEAPQATAKHMSRKELKHSKQLKKGETDIRNKVRAFGLYVDTIIKHYRERKHEGLPVDGDFSEWSVRDHNKARDNTEADISRIIQSLPDGIDFNNAFYNEINAELEAFTERLSKVLGL